ncbi:MAG: hypothetical protein F6J95_028640 [Leptolyngbya sp. SIO1E4]|nr:hypothetical protein [Leptolyngbya sp. SIO1E4]
MSLLFSIVLIAIACLISQLVDGLPHFWHIFSIAPLWLIGIVAASIVAWFVSDP